MMIDTCSDVTNPIDSLLMYCIKLPIGSSFPLPDEFLPRDEDMSDRDELEQLDILFHRWDMLEEIQTRIRNSDFMYKEYGLTEEEAIILMCRSSKWYLHHIAL